MPVVPVPGAGVGAAHSQSGGHEFRHGGERAGWQCGGRDPDGGLELRYWGYLGKLESLEALHGGIIAAAARAPHPSHPSHPSHQGQGQGQGQGRQGGADGLRCPPPPLDVPGMVLRWTGRQSTLDASPSQSQSARHGHRHGAHHAPPSGGGDRPAVGEAVLAAGLLCGDRGDKGDGTHRDEGVGRGWLSWPLSYEPRSGAVRCGAAVGR